MYLFSSTFHNQTGILGRNFWFCLEELIQISITNTQLNTLLHKLGYTDFTTFNFIVEKHNTMEGENNIPVPTISEEVTSEWLSAVLKGDVDESSMDITRNVNAGLGFLSNLIRVKFSAKDGEKKNFSWIVKLLPHKEFVEERNLVISEKMDKSEIDFYEKLLPELLKEVPALEPYMCPFYYGKIQNEIPEKKIEYASVIILKDLKEDGFVTKPFALGPLSGKEIELTIDFFAHFHASSMLHEARQGKRLPEVYDFFPAWYYPSISGKKLCSMHAWFKNSFEPIIGIISDYTTKANPKEKERGMDLISNMLRPLAPHAQNIFDEVAKAGQENACVVHGDLWQNNVLASSSAAVPAIKAIDWQLAGYSDPTYDLGVFLISTGNDNLTCSKFESLVKLYFETMETILNEKKIPGLKQRRSFDKLWTSFKTFGLSFSFIFIMLSLETFTQHEGFLPKFYDALVFLHYEMKLTEFLLKLVGH